MCAIPGRPAQFEPRADENQGGNLKPTDFKSWRKGQGLSQKKAAEALGLKLRIIQYYEKGERGTKDVKIPKSVRLACYAISRGVTDFDGSEPKKK